MADKANYMTAVPKAVSDSDFDGIANALFESIGSQNRLIQEVSLTAVASYLNPKTEDACRQLQLLLNGMFKRGGVDFKSWGAWLTALVNVSIKEVKDGNNVSFVVSKAKKSEKPKRLYTGKVKCWWTASKSSPITVDTVESLIRKLRKVADGEAGDKLITPEAVKMAKELFALDGVADLISTAQANDEAFIGELDREALAKKVKAA